MDKAISIETGEIILIFDILPEKNGKKCNCVCIACQRPLIARTLGTKRRKCFAHTKKDEKACRKIREEKRKTISTEQYARNSLETAPTCLKKEKEIASPKFSIDNTTLQDIWNVIKGPFIAVSNAGWFVLIDTEPREQYKINKGRYLGKINKKIEQLFKIKQNREINGTKLPIWRFLTEV